MLFISKQNERRRRDGGEEVEPSKRLRLGAGTSLFFGWA